MRKKLILDKGKKFGKWEVIHNFPITKKGQTYWLCRCECGLEQHVKLNSLMTGKSTQCVNCAKKEVGIKNRKGTGEISGDMWAQLKKTALNKEMEFLITVEEAWELYQQQECKCALTGDEIKFSGYPYDSEKTSAVLDIIDNNKGYILGNVQWIHKDVSAIKRNIDSDKFVEICKKVTNFTRQ